MISEVINSNVLHYYITEKCNVITVTRVSPNTAPNPPVDAHLYFVLEFPQELDGAMFGPVYISI